MHCLRSTAVGLFIAAVWVALAAFSAAAFGGGFLPAKSHGDPSGSATVIQDDASLHYAGREMYIHLPSRLPPAGSRALVVVLHGGMGNAERIASRRSESALNLDEVAEKYGFIVAYMNGTPVTRFLGDDKKGWNAGECCGQSSENRIDDVGYISGAVNYLARQYGIDPARIYGMGHSNGAMMTQRMVCETGLYAAGISISGGLEIETPLCPGARGRSLLELHGEQDTNVPLEGGYGTGISNKFPKRSQAYSQRVFDRSGARYILQIVPGADHRLGTIASVIERQEGISLPEKAVRFFGLNR